MDYFQWSQVYVRCLQRCEFRVYMCEKLFDLISVMAVDMYVAAGYMLYLCTCVASSCERMHMC